MRPGPPRRPGTAPPTAAAITGRDPSGAGSRAWPGARSANATADTAMAPVSAAVSTSGRAAGGARRCVGHGRGRLEGGLAQVSAREGQRPCVPRPLAAGPGTRGVQARVRSAPGAARTSGRAPRTSRSSGRPTSGPRSQARRPAGPAPAVPVQRAADQPLGGPAVTAPAGPVPSRRSRPSRRGRPRPGAAVPGLALDVDLAGERRAGLGVDQVAAAAGRSSEPVPVAAGEVSAVRRAAVAERGRGGSAPCFDRPERGLDVELPGAAVHRVDGGSFVGGADTRAALTWSGVSCGYACSSSAAAPLTTAAACEVPAAAEQPPGRVAGDPALGVVHVHVRARGAQAATEVPGRHQVDVPGRGAAEEKSATWAVFQPSTVPLGSVAPTAMTYGSIAGSVSRPRPGRRCRRRRPPRGRASRRSRRPRPAGPPGRAAASRCRTTG